jgi:hypothetical protein
MNTVGASIRDSQKNSVKSDTHGRNRRNYRYKKLWLHGTEDKNEEKYGDHKT